MSCGYNTVIVKELTSSILNWLQANFEEGDYYIQPHSVKIKYSGPPLDEDMIMGDNNPLGADYEHRGWEIMFRGEEYAVYFKCTFLDEISEPNTEAFERRHF